VAGSGLLPLALARAARRAGRPVVAVGFPGHTDPALEPEVDDLTWLHPGQVAAALAALRAGEVEEAVLGGKVPKTDLWAAPVLDDEARRRLAGLPDRRDQSLLRAAAALLADCGIRLLPQAELVPEWVADAGVLGGAVPGEAQRRDVQQALPVARMLARHDVGQTVVVRDGVVLAVEAIEGTDEAIRRAGRFAPGACVVKVARPEQDPRFDNPAVGPDTIAALVDARAAVLAVEAGRTLLLEREETVAAADAAGVVLMGVRP
jgi:DUF1009 family protein